MNVTLVVLIVLCFVGIAAAQDFQTNECKGKRIGHAHAHPTDCSKFIMCIGDGVQRVQVCPAGLHYSARYHICDHPYLVNCKISNNVDEKPSSVTIPRNPIPHQKPVSPHGNDENQRNMIHSVHLEISQKYITPYRTGPPQTSRYHTNPDPPINPEYDHFELGPGVPTCERDGMFADPSDCAWYIQCAGGRTHRKPCPPGTYFSYLNQHCGYYKDQCTGEYIPVVDEGRSSRNDYGEYSNRKPVSPQLINDAYIVENKHHHFPDLEPQKDPNHLLAGEELMYAVKQYVNTRGMQDAQEMVTEVMKKEAKMANMYSGRTTAFSGVAGFLGSTPYTKQLSLPASIQLQFLHNVRDRFDLNKIEMQDIMEIIPSILNPNQVMVSPDMPQPHPSIDTCPYPVNSEENQCDVHSRYRTADGSCNNLHHPLWGKSFMALHRFLPPDYADGIDVPRRDQNGHPLPSARRVSLLLFEDKNKPSHVHNTLYVTFGQFLDHDMTRTAVTKLSMEPLGSDQMADVTCGSSECETKGVENRACFPIPVGRHDPDFRGKQCLMFVRTQEVLRDDCSLGPREQLNQLTAYLDASHIYGSNKEQMDRLRDLSDSRRGRLKVTQHQTPGYKPLLPQVDNKDCREVNSTIQCFDAGDGRVNEQIGLAVVHTMWVRYHNSIEEQLHIINPHWDGEKLFQETRKIVYAVWQHTVYNEYLPLTLGSHITQKYGLNLGSYGYVDSYDPHTKADVANSFATAAFRFGHTMIDNFVSFAGPKYQERFKVELSSVMRRPSEVYEIGKRAPGSAVDAIMHGSLSQPAQTPDQFFGKQITSNLFAMNPPTGPGMDLPALNIQRGRDHGIPGYNAWRKWCDLRVARTFEDLTDIPADIRQRLKGLYNHVDDIDLFPGAITERILPGATVGPTFACIIGRQFRNSRVGDKFWYERSYQNFGFTSGQLSTIRKMTISSVICNSCDRVDFIQKYALLQPLSQAFKTLGRHNYAEAYNLASLYRGENNERRPCSDLPVLDLSQWQGRIHRKEEIHFVNKFTKIGL